MVTTVNSRRRKQLTIAMTSITCFQVFLLCCNWLQCFSQLSNFNIYRIQVLWKKPCINVRNLEGILLSTKEICSSKRIPKQRLEDTIFCKVMLIGNMTNMYVERNSLWCWIRIVEAEFVHPTPRSLKLKFITRCSLQSVYCIARWRCHLHGNTYDN